MGTKDKRIDAYITKSADFAKPVMEHLRKLIHKACPEVTETIKWGMPSFEYKGPFVGFAAFKKHAVLGFWKAALMKDSKVLTGKDTKGAMGNLGRIESIEDLPKDAVLLSWINEAKKLNDSGVKLIRSEKPKHERKEYKMPAYFQKELNRSKKAKATFEGFSPSHKREYLEWIVEAKTEETRNKRMATALEWLNEGKSRNWKYQKC
ncbi:MAG: YdeI/OmpD-associated family protein [Ignavibacteria bacterium]|nr:YdeI/OmpD-associated family protein [Ignavibacteria bacterium]